MSVCFLRQEPQVCSPSEGQVLHVLHNFTVGGRSAQPLGCFWSQETHFGPLVHQNGCPSPDIKKNIITTQLQFHQQVFFLFFFYLLFFYFSFWCSVKHACTFSCSQQVRPFVPFSSGPMYTPFSLYIGAQVPRRYKHIEYCRY